jgi:hypothetical protein
MQKSLCYATVRVIVRERRIAVTSVMSVDYNRFMMSVVAVSWRILHGVMHDIAKTGLVHAKFRVLGIKRLTHFVVFTMLARCVTFRLVHFSPSPAEAGEGARFASNDIPQILTLSIAAVNRAAFVLRTRDS